MIRNKPILILDEGTSAIDMQTAYDIENRLLKMENLTLITITHHLEQNLLDNFLYIPIEHSDTAEMISYALKNSFVDNIVKDALVQYRDFLQYNWYDTVDDIYLPYACSLVRESYSNNELSDDVKKVLNKFQPTPQIDALTC